VRLVTSHATERHAERLDGLVIRPSTAPQRRRRDKRISTSSARKAPTARPMLAAGRFLPMVPRQPSEAHSLVDSCRKTTEARFPSVEM